MAIVITDTDYKKIIKSFQLKAFFIDTNLLISFQDAFGESSDNQRSSKLNQYILILITELKQNSLIAYVTPSVVLEYYKYIQVGYYKLKTGNDRFEGKDFKAKRDKDIVFLEGWKLHMKKMKKLFTKTFQIYNLKITDQTLFHYNHSNYDLGDYLIYNSILEYGIDKSIALTDDFDFYSFSDNLKIISPNTKLLSQAKQDKKTI